MHPLPRIAARLFNAPLLVRPDVAETIAASLRARLAGLEAAPRMALMDESGGLVPEAGEPYRVAEGVATISIHGELVNRGAFLNSVSGLTSYDSVKSALRQAAADPRVERVVLDIDSPGGEAAGAMETADEVRALARTKPVTAYVNSLAASAAYALAAAATEVVATPSATLGSIGVVWLHLDASRAYEDAGVKPTLLHAGAFKVDGNPYAGLDDEAKARIQAQIDQVYDLFTASVGKHRPKLGQNGARKTEAGLFMGQGAVAAGLADRVSADPISSSSRRAQTGHFMHNDASAIESAAPPLPEASQRDAQEKEAAMADAMAIAAAKTEGLNEGVAAAKARIAGILDSEDAKGRGALARHFAFSTDLSAEASIMALKAAPAEAAAGAGRMARVPNPAVRPDTSQREPDAQADIEAMYAGFANKMNANLPERWRPRA